VNKGKKRKGRSPERESAGLFRFYKASVLRIGQREEPLLVVIIVVIVVVVIIVTVPPGR
jgi:hypothetical protein